MMQTLIAFLFLNLIYLGGYLLWKIRWGIHENHYFLGFGPELFKFNFKQVQISVGIYIPLPFAGRVYCIREGSKRKIRSEWEFFDSSVSRRLVAASGGLIAILLTGIVINIGITWFETEWFVSRADINTHGIYPSESGQRIGLRKGDKILRINGGDFERQDELFEMLAESDSNIMIVNRDGKEVELMSTKENLVYGRHFEPPFSVLTNFWIGEVMDASGAKAAGLIPGDRIVSVNKIPVLYLQGFEKELAAAEGDTVLLGLERTSDAGVTSLEVSVQYDQTGHLGFRLHREFLSSEKQYSLIEAIPTGTKRAFNLILMNIRAFTKLFAGEITVRAPAGPVGVAEAYGNNSMFGIRFWKVAGLWAMLTFFWNLLPLLGAFVWQTVPLAYEVIAKSRFPARYYTKLTQVS